MSPHQAPLPGPGLSVRQPEAYAHGAARGGRGSVGGPHGLERPAAHGLIVWVIAGNKPARAFYEKLGAELLIEQPFTWDGMELVEVGYGWRNLDSLVAAVDLPAMLH